MQILALPLYFCRQYDVPYASLQNPTVPWTHTWCVSDALRNIDVLHPSCVLLWFLVWNYALLLVFTKSIAFVPCKAYHVP